MKTMLQNTALSVWIEDAQNESQILPDFELGEEISP